MALICHEIVFSRLLWYTSFSMESVTQLFPLNFSPQMSIAVVLLLLIVLLGLLSRLREKSAIDPELSRKLAHILMGLVTLSFPWLFDSSGPVMVLALLSLMLIAAIRFWPPLRSLLGKSILSAERFTLGEFFFPLGILSAFLLSNGDRMSYLVAVLALTLADPLAAFVGIAVARRRRMLLPRKSIEGSLAFMLVSGLIAVIALNRMAGMSLSDSLLIGFNFGLVLALIEALSFWGTDNLTVPMGAVLLMQTIPGFAVTLQLSFMVTVLLMVKVLPAWQRQKAS